jgi:regulator of sigma E protease
LVTGGVSPRSLGSIVTIGEFSGRAAALGLDYYLRFMAMFSINLAVLNLMPIPVLDGGHLVFLAIETVRGGRGLTLEQKLKWSNFGFLIVVGIMLLALSNDVLRLLGL